MNLVIVSHKLCWYGADRDVFTRGGFPFQVRALADRFGSVTVVVPVLDASDGGLGSRLSAPNVNVIPLTPIRGQGFRRKLRMATWTLRSVSKVRSAILGADIVHIPLPSDIGTLGVALALLYRRRLVLRYCADWYISNTTMQRAWKAFATRASFKNMLFLATGEDAEPPSGKPHLEWIFSTAISKQQAADLGRRRYYRHGERVRIVTVGRQELGKGTSYAIEALNLLVSKYKMNASLDIVGDGRELSNLKVQAGNLDIDNLVTFHGNLPHDEVLSVLSQCDIFCLPTLSEGFPKAVVEALMCGLPCVTTEVSVLPRLMSGGGGILTDGSPAGISSAIRTIVDSPEAYQRMSQNALSTGSRYTLEAWADRIYDLVDRAWS